MSDFLEDQRNRYDSEASDHAEHYNDPYTQEYRDLFIRKPLMKENLKDLNILDAMCASGVETQFLTKNGAKVTGLDISQNNANEFESRWNLKCYVSSIHETSLESSSYDAIYICGGLHHVLPLLDETIKEVHRLLRPGGYFYFVEPNKDTLINKIRNYWYKNDSRFGDEEEAISYKEKLKPYLNIGFTEKRVIYGGNVAYIIIGQSLAFGTPYFIKKWFSKPLFLLESILSKIPFMPKLYFCAAWKKT